MNTPTWLSADWEVAERVVARVSTRSGGVSKPPWNSLNLATHVGDCSNAVACNRQRLLRTLPDPVALQWLHQVHGAAAVYVSSAGESISADAVVTSTPGVACCVLTADCLPLFVANRDGEEIALVHAGWRGMAAGVIENAIAAMHSPRQSLRVWLGPAIGPCHYEVGEDVRTAFLHGGDNPSRDLQDCFRPTAVRGKYHADLYAIARHRLARLGIRDVGGGGECTWCRDERYFSHRRNGPTGRMLSLLYIRPAH